MWDLAYRFQQIGGSEWLAADVPDHRVSDATLGRWSACSAAHCSWWPARLLHRTSPASTGPALNGPTYSNPHRAGPRRRRPASVRRAERQRRQRRAAEEAPFRTIKQAARLATPGTTVLVADGTYEGAFTTRAAGAPRTPGSPTSSANKWGAKLVGNGPSDEDAVWRNYGDYVDIQGFDISGR